jgi:hypothetical protein
MCQENEVDLISMTHDTLDNLGNIQFGGLLFLISKLKDDTKYTISSLNNANIHVTMITGDHVYTALSVAVESGIIEPMPSFLPMITSSTKSHNNSENKSTTSTKSTASTISPNTSLIALDRANNIYDDVKIDNTNTLILSHHYVIDTDENGNIIITNCYEDCPSKITIIELLNLANEQQNKIDIYLLNPSILNNTNSVPYKIQIAITGKSLVVIKKQYNNNILISLIRYVKVFARAKPNDKKVIIELLMKPLPLKIDSSFIKNKKTILLLKPLYNNDIEKGEKMPLLSKTYDINDNNDNNKKAKIYMDGDANDACDDDIFEEEGEDVLYCGNMISFIPRIIHILYLFYLYCIYTYIIAVYIVYIFIV